MTNHLFSDSANWLDNVKDRCDKPEWNYAPALFPPKDNREIGRLGSAVNSEQFGRIGLAIVRREASGIGTKLILPGGICTIVSEFTSIERVQETS